MITMTWPQYKRHQCSVNGHTVSISHRERDILFMLMVHYPNPVKRVDLIELLWPNPNTQPVTANRILDVLFCHLRKKIGFSSVESLFGYGFRFNREPKKFLVGKNFKKDHPPELRNVGPDRYVRGVHRTGPPPIRFPSWAERRGLRSNG